MRPDPELHVILKLVDWTFGGLGLAAQSIRSIT